MKATTKQRTACMANPAHVGAVLAARVECDDCGRFAVAGTANNEGAHFHCRDHYLAFLDRQRATRPSREELTRRVGAVIEAARS